MFTCLTSTLVPRNFLKLMLKFRNSSGDTRNTKINRFSKSRIFSGQLLIIARKITRSSALWLSTVDLVPGEVQNIGEKR